MSGRVTFVAPAKSSSPTKKLLDDVAPSCRTTTTSSPRMIPSSVSRTSSRGAATSNGRFANLSTTTAFAATPHRTQRDDVALTLDGRDTRRQASQESNDRWRWRFGSPAMNWCRTDAVSIHFIVDDVFSELDPHRSDRLLNYSQQGNARLRRHTPGRMSPPPSSISPRWCREIARRAAAKLGELLNTLADGFESRSSRH